MSRKQSETPQEAEALVLANKAIAAGAAGKHAEAVQNWEFASDYADAHLPGADIDHWIKNGFGAALYEVGAYERSIDVLRSALDWCSAIKQPLPALTMAKSYRRLGDVEAAQRYLELARELAGDAVLADWDAAASG